MISARKVHALVEDAARGRLPVWAVAGAERRAHMERVAELLDTWADELGLDPTDRTRWRAAGWLHDALRDAPADALRSLVPESLRALPGKLLHGPAAAERLRREGVADEELLQAVASHTIGNADLGALGRALYVADFLEPGRPFLAQWRAALRARMPAERDAVLTEIVRARIDNLLERSTPVRAETIALWNALARERD